MEFLIGRSRSCNYRIDDEYASREHAQLIHTNENESYIIDLKSSCGTTVNGHRIVSHKPKMLEAHDIIRIADTIIPWEDIITGNAVSPVSNNKPDSLDDTETDLEHEPPKDSFLLRIIDNIKSFFGLK